MSESTKPFSRPREDSIETASAPETLSLAVNSVPIATLLADPRNARRHDRRQIQQIAESIKAFGFNVPVLIDRDGKIIAGHGRFEALKFLGRKEVPTISLEHLTSEQARAFAIADNRLTDNSVWDDRLLGEALKELSGLELDFSLEATGFSTTEIDLRIEGLEEAPPQDPADDVDTPMPGPSTSRPGDLWCLGDHRLLCGNALEAEAYASLLDEEQASVVFTDPPYNVAVDGHVSGLGQHRHREFAMASGEMDQQAFTRFLATAFGHMARHASDGALVYAFMDWRHMDEILAAGGEAFGPLRNLIVWAKTNAGMGSMYRSQHELIFLFRNGKGPHRNNVELGRHGRHRTNVWTYPGANSFGRGHDEEGDLLALHPTPKPVALVADALLDCSRRRDIVLDPFLGSGSTLIAAERTGRRCFGIELDTLYVDTIVRRWEVLTGNEAHLASDGRNFADIAADRLEVRHDG